jgi:hypothetical protein
VEHFPPASNTAMSAGDDLGRVPTQAQAAVLAARLLGDVGSRFEHVLRAGRIAAQLAPLFDAREAALLVAAATLHDIGYSPQISQTGFHPLDGGIYLASRGYSRRLAGLVAHHSLAYLNAPAHGIDNLDELFPRETGLLADALMSADMHSAPDGRWVRGADRISEIAGRHTYPATGCRLDLLYQALARVSAAAQSAGLPDLDAGPGLKRPGNASGGATATNLARGSHAIPAPGLEPSHSPRSGSAARLRVAAVRHANVAAEQLSASIR